MNIKKYLENRISGWLPKEPTLPTPQNSRMLRSRQTNRRPSMRTIGIIATMSAATSILLLIFPHYLFPQAYVPKANPAWGYVSPNTLVAWIVLGLALALLVFSTLAFTWLGLRLKLEGSKWATRTWFTPRARTEREKRTLKISGVVNAIILSTFLGVHALTSSNLWTADLTALSLIALAVSGTLANLTLYLYSKKQTTEEGKES